MVEDRKPSPGDLVILPAHDAPGRFEPWPPDVQARTFELWGSIGARNAGRTALLLVRELGEEAPVPTASTVRRWAHDQAWAARADADLERSHGRAVYELQVGWLAALQLAQRTLLDGMAGALDDAPGGGLARIKSAEITLRVIERAGLLAILPTPPEPERADTAGMSREEQEAYNFARIARGKRGRRS